MNLVLKNSPLLNPKIGQTVFAKKWYSYLLTWLEYDKCCTVSTENFSINNHDSYNCTKLRNYSDYNKENTLNIEIEENNNIKEYQNRGTRLREEFSVKEKYWETLVDLEYLKEKDVIILEAHHEAIVAGHFTYDDPETGFRVMTRLRHFLRKTCCGNACRHCIYDHQNVPEELKENRVYNSAFWVYKWELKKPLPEEKIEIIKQPDSSIDLLFRESQDQEEEEEEIDPQLFKH